MTKGQVFTIFFTFTNDNGNEQCLPVEVMYSGLAQTIGSSTFYQLKNTSIDRNYNLTADFINSAQPEPVALDHATDVTIR